MSVYKRMKLACCFDCGRSEQDCSCMSGSVHSNMDTLQRAYPLSSVSVHDCATTLRACKLHRPTHAVTCLWCVLCVSYRVPYRTCVRACVRCNLFIVTPLFVYPWSMCFCVVLLFFFLYWSYFFSVSISLFLYIWLDFLWFIVCVVDKWWRGSVVVL